MSPSLNHYSASNVVMRSTVRFLLGTATLKFSYRDINSLGPKPRMCNAEVNLVAWKCDEVVSILHSREDSYEELA